MNASLSIPAPLDPGFAPAALFNRNYVKAAKASGQAVPLVLGLEREGGLAPATRRWLPLGLRQQAGLAAVLEWIFLPSNRSKENHT